MNFFVAKFTTVNNSDSFKANKRGVLPLIGTVIAGVATGSIIDGTVFSREGYQEGQLYLCENYYTEDYPDYPQVRIISPVSAVELLAFRQQLGEGRLHRPNANAAAAEAIVTVDEAEVVEG